MKSMKIFTATALLTALSGTIVFPANAEVPTKERYAIGTFATVTESAKEFELNKYMEKSGYPQAIITNLDVEQKQRIYNEKAVYASHKQQVGNLNESGPSQLHDITGIESANPEQMNNFTQTLTTSRVTTPSEPGKVEFLLDYNWTWNQSAIFNLKDKFGIAWTDDFDAYPSSAVYAYRAYGRSDLGGYGEKATGNQYTYEKYTSSGIGWEYDILESWLTTSYLYTTYKHKGWGQVKIGRWSNKSGLNEQTSAVASYFHKEGAITGELSFQGTLPSIGISYASNYDKTDDIAAEPFSWTHYK